LGRIDGVSYRCHILPGEREKNARDQLHRNILITAFALVISVPCPEDAERDLRWSTTSIPVIPEDQVLITYDHTPRIPSSAKYLT
jgi:hypothetical protein